jgi:hypothetical protein
MHADRPDSSIKRPVRERVRRRTTTRNAALAYLQQLLPAVHAVQVVGHQRRYVKHRVDGLAHGALQGLGHGPGFIVG